MIYVFRYPTHQENQGRRYYIGEYPTLQKAREIIASYAKDGYYSERDFYTTEE